MSKISKQQELDRIDNEMGALQDQMKTLTVDESSKAALREEEPQSCLSRREIKQSNAPMIKPSKSFPARGKPIAKLEAEHKRAWEYVTVIAENKEVLGEMIEFWLSKFPQDPINYWQLPVNVAIQVPYHVAEHIAKNCQYTVYKMADRDPRSLGHGDFAQTMVIEERRRRLDCRLAGFGF
jgi:hypothetical protein